MKNILILLSFVYVQSLFAGSITEDPYFEYNAYFTNPNCQAYEYEDEVKNRKGELVTQKKQNAYCKKGDFSANNKRETTPHYNLIKLIRNKDVKSMFLTYLSFSNSEIAKELCEAIETRNLKVTFIIDSKNKYRDSGRKRLDMIANCKPNDRFENKNMPETFFRGNTKGLGYAHNKLIIADYKSNSKKQTFVFSSGNMSSGTILHHENWHFITLSKSGYFAQAHACLKEGMLDHANSKSEFKAFINACRLEIKAQEADDLKTYFVPSDGSKAMGQIVSLSKKATKMYAAAHRLTHRDFLESLRTVAQTGDARIVVDDDLYWTGQLGEGIGSNMLFEHRNLMTLVRGDVKIRYIESNESSRLLHHNKFAYFELNDGREYLFTGAGNFTKAAFTKNFENFYLMSFPAAIEAVKKQYRYLFDVLGKSYFEMPTEYKTL
jgi:hypothetical protein